VNKPARIKKLESLQQLEDFSIKIFLIDDDGTITHKGKEITRQQADDGGAQHVIKVDPDDESPYK